MTILLPGDFEVVKIFGAGGALIDIGEFLNGAKAFSHWDHARVYLGQGQWLQAEPKGAEIVLLGDRPSPGGVCSAGIPSLALAPSQQDLVWQLGQNDKGIPYSVLDYFALAARRVHIPAPGLNAYIANSGHMMCSQLVDDFRLRLGSHLFTDNRPPGFVTPWDLGHLIKEAV